MITIQQQNMDMFLLDCYYQTDVKPCWLFAESKVFGYIQAKYYIEVCQLEANIRFEASFLNKVL